VLKIGDTLVIDAGTRGVSTAYTWYKDNQIIPDETDSILEIIGFDIDDAGTYYMAATNTLLPDLTIYRHEVLVQSDGTSSTLKIRPVRLQLFPNPVSDRIYINDLTGEGNVKIMDMHGRLVFDKWLSFESGISIEQFPAGSYVMLVKSNDTLYSAKFIRF